MSTIKLLVFLLLNRLFYCLFNYQISRFLRTYSFKIFLLEVLLLEDIQKLIFILIRNFSVLFRIKGSAQSLGASIIPLTFGGLLLFCFITLLPFQRYLHGRLSKYFLTNMFRIHGSLPLSCLLYTAKPMIVACIQALCYDCPSVQLFLLGIVELVAIFLMSTYQQKYDLFISKKLFCIDWLMSFTLGLMNLCFYVKFVVLT